MSRRIESREARPAATPWLATHFFPAPGAALTSDGPGVQPDCPVRASMELPSMDESHLPPRRLFSLEIHSISVGGHGRTG